MILNSLFSGIILFTSFAMRTPNVQPNPDDYEFSLGISNENYYPNVIVTGKLFKIILFSNFVIF